MDEEDSSKIYFNLAIPTPNEGVIHLYSPSRRIFRVRRRSLYQNNCLLSNIEFNPYNTLQRHRHASPQTFVTQLMRHDEESVADQASHHDHKSIYCQCKAEPSKQCSPPRTALRTPTTKETLIFLII